MADREWGGGQGKNADAGRIAQVAQEGFRSVYPGWTKPDGSKNEGGIGSPAQRAVEAQLAAASVGRKPLYIDPWGEDDAQRLIEELKWKLPKGVTMAQSDGNLLVFREEVVKPIIDSDTTFYKRDGETLLDSIARVSRSGENGELLGYGARHMLVSPAYSVTINKGDETVLYYFVSAPDEFTATRYATERAKDFEEAFGWDDVKFVLGRLV